MPRRYCGTNAVLPAGYDAFDDRYSCLRKGFGVARAKYGESRQCKTNYHLFIISIVILSFVVLALLVALFFRRKRQIAEEDDEKTRSDHTRSVF